MALCMMANLTKKREKEPRTEHKSEFQSGGKRTYRLKYFVLIYYDVETKTENRMVNLKTTNTVLAENKKKSNNNDCVTTEKPISFQNFHVKK